MNRVSGHNIFHLSPKAFAHFWAWWGLFNSPLALPIRQGSLFPGGKTPTPKFSRHLSTIKYRITLAPLLISHVYHQESQAGWKAGQATCVGIKLMMDHFHADMHQREQVTSVLDQITGQIRSTGHKPFYSAEVVLIGSELRAVRAIFAEPEKALFSVPVDGAEPETQVPNAPSEPLSSPWVDLDDFVQLDWSPSDRAPRIWLIPCGFCPRFTYLKRVPIQDSGASSRFGQEDTHHCLQGMEDCE
jgi:Fmp27, WPPW motif-containing RBG unit